MTTVTIPNINIQLTVEQLITAVNQLKPHERTQIARALTVEKLDTELAQLIAELYSQPPVTDISDEEILAEITAVRQQRQ